jgi:hypothetical protein
MMINVTIRDIMIGKSIGIIDMIVNKSGKRVGVGAQAPNRIRLGMNQGAKAAVHQALDHHLHLNHHPQDHPKLSILSISLNIIKGNPIMIVRDTINLITRLNTTQRKMIKTFSLGKTMDNPIHLRRRSKNTKHMDGDQASLTIRKEKDHLEMNLNSLTDNLKED